MSEARIIMPRENCLVLQPVIVQHLGKSPALFLQQLHYWLTSESSVGVTYKGKRWIYNSIKDWANNIKTISEATIKRSISYLRNKNIIFIESLNPNKAIRTNYYTINYERLNEIIGHEKKEDFFPITTSIRKTLNHKKNLNHSIKMIHPLDQNDPIIKKDSENTSENFTYKSDNQKTNISLQSDKNKPYQVKQVEKKINNISKEMIDIWVEIVEENKQNLLLNKKRAQYLVAAFKSKFNASLDKWKDFCLKITQSNFLMGRIKKTFKASLDWVLRFDVIQRIFEGDFGLAEFKNEKTNITQNQLIDDMSNKIQSTKGDEYIKTIQIILLKKNGICTYKNWFETIKWSREENNIILSAPNKFMLNYINTNFKKSIDLIWKNININGEIILKQT